jgi:hypothetical protein
VNPKKTKASNSNISQGYFFFHCLRILSKLLIKKDEEEEEERKQYYQIFQHAISHYQPIISIHSITSNWKTRI